MTIQLDKEKRAAILGWLKQGHINTLDLPDLYGDQIEQFRRAVEESGNGERGPVPK